MRLVSSLRPADAPSRHRRRGASAGLGVPGFGVPGRRVVRTQSPKTQTSRVIDAMEMSTAAMMFSHTPPFTIWPMVT